MILKRSVVIVLLWIAVALNASAAITVSVQTKKNADINAIAASLGGTVLDSLPNGDTYLLSIPSMPSVLPNGVISISLDTPVVLPRFRGVAINTSMASGSVPWFAGQPAF